jgi:hypothetical protein
MTEFKRETHTVNGVKIILLTAGSGEPLLFLHGPARSTASSSPSLGPTSSGSFFRFIRASANPPTIRR